MFTFIATVAIFTSCATSPDFDHNSDPKKSSAASRPKTESTTIEDYEKQVSCIVKAEWDRSCVIYKDFITPGSLKVQFFVRPDGRVEKVMVVQSDVSSEVAKGFTLNAIRKANLPAMPEKFHAKYADKPLECIFTFHF